VPLLARSKSWLQGMGASMGTLRMGAGLSQRLREGSVLSTRWSEIQNEMRPMMIAAKVPRILTQLQEASGWNEKNTLQRIAYPAEACFIVARDLSIPLLDEPRWRKQICALALLGAPQLLLYKFASPGMLLWGAMPLAVFVLLLTAPVAIAVYMKLDDAAPPTSRPLSIFLLTVAFIASCIWTDILANELVSGLEFLGTALGLSKSVLGLTVLAWGNSLGDFVADTALARAGNPKMGAAGCFGGPLFNLLIGTGVSMSVHTTTQGPLCFEYDKTIPISLLFLIGSVIFTLVGVPSNKWKLTKRFGVMHVCYYATFIVVMLAVTVADPPFLDGGLHSWYGVHCAKS